jgi:hypothetical protein
MRFLFVILSVVVLSTSISCSKEVLFSKKSDVNIPPKDSKDLYDIKVESFSLKSKVPGNENVTCYYTRPYKKDGSLASRANTVVYYAHYPMEKNYYKVSQKSIFINLARQSGFTVFSVDFSNSPLGEGVSDPETFYYYSQSGSFETVIEAYDTMMKKEKMKPVKLFFTGLSGGSSMAVNFINRYPEKVDALALFAGYRYSEHVKKNSAVWLIQYTLNSHTKNSNELLKTDLQKMGKFPIVVETMPSWNLRGKNLFNHCENWNANQMRQIFLEDVADLRSDNNNIMPSEKQWPYVISLSDKTKLLKNSGQKLPFKDPLYMPSERFYKEYMNLISPPVIVKLPKNNRMIIGVPALFNKKAKGVILNLKTSPAYSPQEVDYDARFFADNGYLYLTAAKSTDIKVFKKILEEKYSSLLKDTPVYILVDKVKLLNSDSLKNEEVIFCCNSNTEFDEIKPVIEKQLGKHRDVSVIANSTSLYEAVVKVLNPDENSLLRVVVSEGKMRDSSGVIFQKRNKLILDLINSSHAQCEKSDKKTILSPR